MKRPQVAIGFAYAAHALVRRAEEMHVRLAANGVECTSRFAVARRAVPTAITSVLAPGAIGTEPREGDPRPKEGSRSRTRLDPLASGPTEPSLPVWRGPIRGRR